MRNKDLFSSGARLVRRHIRLLIWIFIVNLALAWLGSAPVRSAVSPILDHSLASHKLVDRFDMAAMIELASQPEINFHVYSTASLHFSLVFLLYMVFINGGVLTVYREHRKLTAAEFFEMSGALFWRNVRLLLLSLIPIAVVGGLFQALSSWSDNLTEDAANAKTGFWVLIAGGVLLWIVALFVRAWFDVAQSITVARNERGMLRSSGRAFVMAIRGFSPLLTTYISIHIVGILAAMLICVAVLYVPHAAFRFSFLPLEVLVVIEIAVRLGQKAACMTWVENLPVPAAIVADEPSQPVLSSLAENPQSV